MLPDKLDQLADHWYSLVETKRELEAQIKAITEQINEAKAKLDTQMEAAGTDIARGKLARVVRTEQLVPRIVDWGAVSEWVMENDGVYLLHRRVSSGPWKELLDAGEEVPGIEPYRKKDISLTKLRD